MIATCVKFGLQATLTPTGRDRYSMQLPNSFAGKCPVLAEKLREKAKLEGAEIDCLHMNQAAGLVFGKWRERNRI